VFFTDVSCLLYVGLVYRYQPSRQPPQKAGGCIVIAASEDHVAQATCALRSLAWPSVQKIVFVSFNVSKRAQASALAEVYFAWMGSNVAWPEMFFHDPVSYLPKHLYAFERRQAGFKPPVLQHLQHNGHFDSCRSVWYIDASIRFKQDPFLASPHPKYGISVVGIPHLNAEFTHPGTYSFFSLGRSEDRVYQFQSGSLLFDPRSPTWQAILDKWLQCCVNMQCIMPPGSTRSYTNAVPEDDPTGVILRAHRDDQSALNLAVLSTIGAQGHTDIKLGYMGARGDLAQRIARGEQQPEWISARQNEFCAFSKYAVDLGSFILKAHI